MRSSWARGLGAAGVAVALVAGCAVDIGKQVVADPATQTKVMDAIAGNEALAGKVVDRLLAGDTRHMVLGKVLANDESARQILAVVAHNPNALDMVLATAVQDSAMRVHVMTLFKGMQMAGVK
jgi:hypothetical protein